MQKTSHDKEIKEIWKLFRETDRKMEKTRVQMKEMNQETREQMQETDRKMEETDRKMEETREQLQETGRYLKALAKDSDKRIKELDELFTGQWGKLMEALVQGDLVKLLKQRDIQVTETATNIEGCYKDKQFEFDIIAKNGREVVVVEVKTTLKVDHIKYFVEKLNNFKKWKREYKDNIIYGAVAYLKANQSSSKYAGKQGLFVIRATGSSASIINDKNFKPKNFS